MVYFKKSDPRIATDVIITSFPQHVPDDEIQCEWITNASTKAAILNTPGYPALMPKPPRVDLYEARPTPDMGGQGLFAKCNIKPGEVIFIERPLIVCSRQILTPGKFHFQTITLIKNNKLNYLSGSEGLLEDAIARLPPESQTDFKDLHNTYICNGFGHLLGIAKTNAFGIRNLSDSSDKETTYAGIYKIGSRINHRSVLLFHQDVANILLLSLLSCIPNVLYHFNLNSFSVQFFAIREIKSGEQLFHSYCRADKTLEDRRAIFALHGFECDCRACANATPESDRLRKEFNTQITNFQSLALQKPPLEVKQDILEQALQLEKDMVKEGLKDHMRFGSLLVFIAWAYAMRGNQIEYLRYRVLGQEIQDRYFKNQD